MELTYGRDNFESRDEYADNIQKNLYSKRDAIRHIFLAGSAGFSLYAGTVAMSDAEKISDAGEDIYGCGQPPKNETKRNATDNSTDDVLKCEEDEKSLLEDQHVSAEGLLEQD